MNEHSDVTGRGEPDPPSAILDHVRSRGAGGATAAEIGRAAGRSKKSVRHELEGLARQGLVRAVGVRKDGRAGRPAHVWVAAGVAAPETIPLRPEVLIPDVGPEEVDPIWIDAVPQEEDYEGPAFPAPVGLPDWATPTGPPRGPAPALVGPEEDEDVVPDDGPWQSFQWEGFTLRGGLLPNGDPFLIAKDVCEVAGVRHVTQALDRLDPDEKGWDSVPTLGGIQRVNYVTEPGFYRLIFGFRNRENHPNTPTLNRFVRWVTHDVLPALRKTGRYEMPGIGAPKVEATPPPGGPADPLLALLSGQRVILESQIQLRTRQLENERQAAEARRIAEETATRFDRFAEAVQGTVDASIQAGVQDLKSHVDATVARFGGQQGYFTMLGYTRNVRKLEIADGQVNAEARRVAEMCRMQGIVPHEYPDVRFGHINAYPIEVLDLWFARRGHLYRPQTG
jgi:prophage antirepressor-like protein